MQQSRESMPARCSRVRVPLLTLCVSLPAMLLLLAAALVPEGPVRAIAGRAGAVDQEDKRIGHSWLRVGGTGVCVCVLKAINREMPSIHPSIHSSVPLCHRVCCLLYLLISHPDCRRDVFRRYRGVLRVHLAPFDHRRGCSRRGCSRRGCIRSDLWRVKTALALAQGHIGADSLDCP